MRVILVDDEEWCLEELSEILSGVEGIEIIGSFSIAREALNAALWLKPDVAFLDVQMPCISGLDLAAMLKERHKKLSVVLMSEKECFARNGFDVGVDDYVLKPLRPERVIKALGRVGHKVDYHQYNRNEEEKII